MVGYLLHEQEMPSNNKGNSGIIMRQLTKTNTQTKKPKEIFWRILLGSLHSSLSSQ